MNKRNLFWIKFILCIMGICSGITIGVFSIGINIIEFLILIVGMIACGLFMFAGDV